MVISSLSEIIIVYKTSEMCECMLSVTLNAIVTPTT
jgi:hypothetical protein